MQPRNKNLESGKKKGNASAKLLDLTKESIMSKLIFLRKYGRIEEQQLILQLFKSIPLMVLKYEVLPNMLIYDYYLVNPQKKEIKIKLNDGKSIKAQLKIQLTQNGFRLYQISANDYVISGNQTQRSSGKSLPMTAQQIQQNTENMKSFKIIKQNQKVYEYQMLFPRSHHIVTFHQSKFYLLSGFDDCYLEVQRHCEYFDFKSKQFVQIADIISDVFNTGCGCLGNFLYLFGGIVQENKSTYILTDRILSYDILLDQ